MAGERGVMIHETAHGERKGTAACCHGDGGEVAPPPPPGSGSSAPARQDRRGGGGCNRLRPEPQAGAPHHGVDTRSAQFCRSPERPPRSSRVLPSAGKEGLASPPTSSSLVRRACVVPVLWRVCCSVSVCFLLCYAPAATRCRCSERRLRQEMQEEIQAREEHALPHALLSSASFPPPRWSQPTALNHEPQPGGGLAAKA